MKLTKADREFMSRGERRRAMEERRRAVRREERVGATPETLAKLVPDPLAELLRMQLIDSETKDAALEMGEVYVAVYGAQMPSARGTGGRPELSNRVAWIHEHRYLPWARRWSKVRLRSLPLQPAVIDLVVLGRGVALAEIAEALRSYAEIRAATPLPRADELARVVDDRLTSPRTPRPS
jgi:hypothetical protein